MSDHRDLDQGADVRARDAIVFRYRFWLFTATFAIGFSLAGVDHVNATIALLEALHLGDTSIRPAFALGAACVTAAALIRTWAAAYLNTSVVHDDRMHSNALVASGPYRYVRNPLYLGGELLSMGFAMLASRSGAIVILAGILAITRSLIAGEERLLSAAQGESYAAYRRTVPRLLPSLTPRLPASGQRPRWGQAFVGEAMFWLFALGMIAFVIMLQPRVVIATAIGAPAIHLGLMRTLRERLAGS